MKEIAIKISSFLYNFFSEVDPKDESNITKGIKADIMPLVNHNMKDFFENSINNPLHVYFYNPITLRHTLDLLKYRKNLETPIQEKIVSVTLDFEKYFPGKDEALISTPILFDYSMKYFQVQKKDVNIATIQSSENVIISFEGMYIPPERYEFKDFLIRSKVNCLFSA